jgi:hypothetical protein
MTSAAANGYGGKIRHLVRRSFTKPEAFFIIHHGTKTGFLSEAG